MSSWRMINAIHGQRAHHDAAARLGKVLFYGTFGLLLLGPLAFGGVEPWSIFMIEAGSAVLVALWIGKQVIEGKVRIRQNSLFVPAGIFGVLIASQLTFRITAYPHATMEAALLYVSYALLCFLVSQTLERGSQARRLALIISIYGAAVASFALIQGISSNGRLYWLRQPRMGGWIYGPYVNHNHYAGLMEMLIPIPLVLSLTHLASSRARNLAATAAAVMVGTIFLSGSRGGMLAIVIEVMILGVIFVQQRRGWRTMIGIGLFVAIVAGLLIWVGGSDLTQRIASVEPSHTEISGDTRSDINRDGLRMFLNKPILGWGLGTFPVVYPQFRTFHTNLFVNEAHNDYLQLLVETGLLGFAIMVLFVVVAFKRAIKKLKNWTSDINGAAALACVLGMSGILVHSAVDFNLQVPANAVLFYVLCTVAASPRFLKPAGRRHTLHSSQENETENPQGASQPTATNF
jgi:O-antigen ligase